MNVGSVFSGAGLLDYGLTLAGFEHAWFCEAVPFRRDILARRWPGVPVYPDIRELDDPPACDLLAGGFPCKGISAAGKREGFGHPETVLWREQARLIRLLRPRYVLVENVAALLALNRGECFGEVLGDLAALGYECWWDCLPACAVGAPHRRDRVFIVAHSAQLGERTAADEAHAEPGGRDTWALARCGDRHVAPDPDRAGRQERDSTEPARAQQSAADPCVAPDPEGASGQGARPRGEAFDWGDYREAVERWEALTRPVPEPLVRGLDTRDARRLARSALSAYGDGVQCQVAQLLGIMIREHAKEHGVWRD